jgi:hypothetical protein
MIRYADNFIININSEKLFKQFKKQLKLFLKERSLTLSKKKLKIIK